jgi:hypothetical protein
MIRACRKTNYKTVDIHGTDKYTCINLNDNRHTTNTQTCQQLTRVCLTNYITGVFDYGYPNIILKPL